MTTMVGSCSSLIKIAPPKSQRSVRSPLCAMALSHNQMGSACAFTCNFPKYFVPLRRPARWPKRLCIKAGFINVNQVFEAKHPRSALSFSINSCLCLRQGSFFYDVQTLEHTTHRAGVNIKNSRTLMKIHIRIFLNMRLRT